MNTSMLVQVHANVDDKVVVYFIETYNAARKPSNSFLN